MHAELNQAWNLNTQIAATQLASPHSGWLIVNRLPNSVFASATLHYYTIYPPKNVAILRQNLIVTSAFYSATSLRDEFWSKSVHLLVADLHNIWRHKGSIWHDPYFIAVTAPGHKVKLLFVTVPVSMWSAYTGRMWTVRMCVNLGVLLGKVRAQVHTTKTWRTVYEWRTKLH